MAFQWPSPGGSGDETLFFEEDGRSYERGGEGGKPTSKSALRSF
jgi:hypothetical protein